MTEETKTFDEEYVKELRQEAANYRVRLREKEQELENLQHQFSEKDNKVLSKELEYAAKAAGAVDPQTVARLVDTEQVEKDEEGNFTNIDSLVQSLVEEKPFLKGGDVGRASNPGDNGQPKIFSRAEVDQMTPEEINANWSEIQDQMSKNLIR